MACKRGATSELNHENWNAEDEPEEAGTFAIAPQEVLEKRVVRTAKRRLAGTEGGSQGAVKNAFGGFSGFKATPPPTTAAFNFLKSNSTSTLSTSQPSSIFSNLTSINGTPKTPENGLTSSSIPSIHIEKAPEGKDKDPPKEKNDKIFKESSEYFEKLKGLNESVAQWIKTHVDANPFCILTPIFRDYERYLKDIEAKRAKEPEKSTEPEKTKEPAKPSLTFDKTPKEPEAKSESIFFKKTPETPATSTSSIFGSGTPGKSIFGNSAGKSVFGSESTSFLNKSKESPEKSEQGEAKAETTKALSFPSTTPGTFSFGQSSSTGTSSASFTFGTGKPFSFGSGVVVPPTSEAKEDEEKEEEDEPPKPEFKPVTESGAVYEKRCKVFFKKDKVYSDRGVGILFLKPTPGGKTQLIVRADNSLGNLLINTLLTESLRTQRMNKNTVMVVCLPLPDSQPPPTPVLLRVKTSEDADSLLEALENNKK